MLSFHQSLLFLSQLELPSMLSLINIFLIQVLQHVFQRPFFLYLKHYLRSTSRKSEFVQIKRHNVNHVLCNSFLSQDPIPVVNVNIKFTPLRLRVHVFKSFFRILHVSALKAPTILTVNTTLPPNICKYSLTHQSNPSPLSKTSMDTYRLSK